MIKNEKELKKFKNYISISDLKLYNQEIFPKNIPIVIYDNSSWFDNLHQIVPNKWFVLV